MRAHHAIPWLASAAAHAAIGSIIILRVSLSMPTNPGVGQGSHPAISISPESPARFDLTFDASDTPTDASENAEPSPDPSLSDAIAPSPSTTPTALVSIDSDSQTLTWASIPTTLGPADFALAPSAQVSIAPTPNPAESNNAPTATSASTPPASSGSAHASPQPLGSNKPPAYPTESRRRRESGTVVLHLSLDSLGSVVDASIATSSGHPRLDAAALDAAKKWRFSPETREGTPVSCELDLPVDFILRDKSR